MISRLRPYLRPAPVALALFVLVLVLPGLGRFGLWEPEERQLAEVAARASGGELWAATVGTGTPGRALWPALGMSVAGVHEAAARLPGALLALAAIAALAWAGAGLFGRRAGLLAGAVLAASPLFVLEARQLMSDVPLLLGHALILGALARLSGKPGWPLPVAPLLLGGLGLAISVLAAGVMMGLLLPLAAALAAALVTGDPRERTLAPPVRVALAIASAALILAITLRTYTAGAPSWWLGGVPSGASPGRSFEALLRIHGFGLFPFTALAALALLQPLGQAGQPGDAGGPRFGDALVSLLAGFGLALGAVQWHLLGEARLAALIPAALATGRLLDDLGARTRDPAGLPALALGTFAAIGSVICARDLSQNPEDLVSLHLKAKLLWPPGLDVRALLLGVGSVAALASLALTARPEGDHRAVRWLQRAQAMAPAALLAAAGSLALVLAHHLVPTLSRHLSSKHLLDSYHRHAGADAALVLLPSVDLGSGAFQRAPTVPVPDIGALAAAFQQRPALFALVPRAELANIQDRFTETGAPYLVADASSSRLLLLAGQPVAGLEDQNPLHQVLWRPGRGSAAPPWPRPRLPLDSTFAGAIQLVGADLPAAVRRPGHLPLTLFFRITARPPAGYKIFVHLERPGVFLNGDHPPLDGVFSTGLWRPGDLVRDHHEIDVPLVVASSGSYSVHVGFWPGGDNARRLPITAGPSDGRNRVHVATVVVR